MATVKIALIRALVGTDRRSEYRSILGEGLILGAQLNGSHPQLQRLGVLRFILQICIEMGDRLVVSPAGEKDFADGQVVVHEVWILVSWQPRADFDRLLDHTERCVDFTSL